MTSYCAHKENTEMWIGDTGATCHMKSSTEGMYDLEKCHNINIFTANGSMSSVTHIGNYKGNVHWKIQENCDEICEGNIGTCEKSVFTFYSDAAWLGPIDRNQTQCKNLEDKERRYRIWVWPKGVKKRKWRLFDGNVNWTYQHWRNKKNEIWRKNTKIEGNRKWRKGKSCSERGEKIYMNDLHEKLGHPAEEMAKTYG